MTTAVWFRSDLRCDDNQALHTACAGSEQVLGLFLVTHGQWTTHHWGARKQVFVWQHALALRDELAARGIALHIVIAPHFADAPSALAAFVNRHGVQQVLVNAEYGVDELARDQHVARTLAQHGVPLVTRHDFTLLAPGSVQTKQGTDFRVFTPFRRAWLAQARATQIACSPSPAARAPVAAPPLPDWNTPHDSLDHDWWPIGEAAAAARLRSFVEQRIEHYHEDRDIPALDGTSRLSPYLACGALSVRRCLQAALAANHGEWDSGRRGVCIWIDELIWREFYTHVLAAFPRVSRNKAFRPETEQVQWREPGAALTCWQQGQTGFALVDAGMRQLLEHGWMHNRVRMVCAMFLSKHLLIDWRHGERWFMQQLVDADLAANNGGWQWSASTGTDAAPWFRILSPTRQAERFDPEGQYVRRYVRELAGVDQRVLNQPGHPDLLAAGYAPPLVDAGIARAQAIDAFRGLSRQTGTS